LVVSDKAAGKAKEAWGALTGDEQLKREGQALQRKAKAEEEAEKRARTNQAEAQAKGAERKRDRQAAKDKGLLGGVDDTVNKLL
jgi:uncharacterized protein YjbJ (UPF0337 family)